MQYASLARRIIATLIDSVVLFFALVVMLGIAAAMGAVKLPEPGTTNPFSMDATMPAWTYFATYGLLFGYYAVLEGLTGGSVGKHALGTMVRMDDGSIPTGSAIVVRNLIRIPEALFWYIPAGVSCILSGRNKRLGDHAAATVVVLRATAPQAARGAQTVVPAPPPVSASAEASPDQSSQPPAPPAPPEPSLYDALAHLKATVLATRGAHETYRRFSELELAKERPAALETADEADPDYSPEYVAAWYSLSDAVHAMDAARVTAEAAGARADTDLETALAAQPDLAYLVRELAPYLAADAHEHLHEAYMSVLRGETKA
jgi:uncharacterized RDD family membrane protein YckC